ncbi:MAG: hypothetical protein WBL39_17300 [Terrimicrobiaceae bacterium]
MLLYENLAAGANVFYKKLVRKPDDDGYELLVKVVERMYSGCEADLDVKQCEFGPASVEHEERLRRLTHESPAEKRLD